MSVAGGATAECPVTNRMGLPVNVYASGRGSQELAPGQSTTVPEDPYVFQVYGAGGYGDVAGCQAGRKFEVIPSSAAFPTHPALQRVD